MNTQQSENQAIIDAVQKLHGFEAVNVTDPETANELPLLLVPSGLQVFDPKKILDQWLDAPRRVRGTATAETLASFCDMVNYHKTLATAVFASKKDGASMQAVIDYHGKSDISAGSVPAFGEHRIEYAFPMAPEFVAWTKASGWRGQMAFATFLDERRFEIVDPLDLVDITEDSIVHDVLVKATPRDKRGDLHEQKTRVFASPGDLMQLVETLSGTTKTKWAEVKTDRFGGMRATIEKEGRIDGDEKIPTFFLVEVAAFLGGDKLTLPARVKAQVTDRGLQLAAELIGVDRVLEKAFEEAIEEVFATTSCKVRRGTPET